MDMYTFPIVFSDKHFLTHKIDKYHSALNYDKSLFIKF